MIEVGLYWIIGIAVSQINLFPNQIIGAALHTMI